MSAASIASMIAGSVTWGTTFLPDVASADIRSTADKRARRADAMQRGRDTLAVAGFSTKFENRCGRIGR